MKKISIALAALITFASADFLSLSAGVGEWQQNISGYFKIDQTVNYFAKHTPYGGNVGYMGLKDSVNPYVWVKFIHPLPLIPNIRFQYTKYHSTGYSNYIAGNVKIFGDASIPFALTNSTTQNDINSYDLTFFYELKPVVADIEAGFGIDYWKGESKIYGDQFGSISLVKIDEDWSVILPYLYAHVETMQIEGFSILGSVKWAKVGDNHHYDYTGALKYTFDVPGPVNAFVKAGYRYKDVMGVDGSNETKLQYKGAFLEIGAKF